MRDSLLSTSDSQDHYSFNFTLLSNENPGACRDENESTLASPRSIKQALG